MTTISNAVEYNLEQEQLNLAKATEIIRVMNLPNATENLEAAVAQIQAQILSGSLSKYPHMIASLLDSDRGWFGSLSLYPGWSDPETDKPYLISMSRNSYTSSTDLVKAAYYELMSFCTSEDEPFCDPNCAIKVVSGITVGTTFTGLVNGYQATFNFSVEIPATVQHHLDQKGMIAIEPGYVSHSTPVIVCKSAPASPAF